MTDILAIWTMNWGAFIGLAGLCIAYGAFHNFKTGAWLQPFAIAISLLAVCFFSPLQVLSADYLFTAHMIVHVLLLLVVGPLLVLSLRRDQVSNKSVLWLSQKLYHRPILGWLVGVGIMWVWHIPAVFNFAMNLGHTSPRLAATITFVESASLLLAGMLFGWGLISPVPQLRLPALHAVVYLFTACIGCSVLGLLITFAPAGMYHHFLSAVDSFGLNSFILNRWQLNQAMDQQIAGLIMWVPCCMLYVVYSLYLLIVWFNEKDLRVVDAG